MTEKTLAESTSDQYKMVAEAADILGYISSCHEDERGMKYNYRITVSEGHQLVVTFLDYFKTPKIQVSGIYPTAPISEDLPKPQTSYKQGAKGIVNAVKRMMPKYMELMKEANSQLQKHNEYLAKVQEVRDSLLSVKGARTYREGVVVDSTYFQPTSSAVYIDRLTLSLDKALRVAAILAE